MAKRFTVMSLMTLATLAVLLGIGCGPSTELTGSVIPNSLPNTEVTARPPDVLEAGFVVQFYWTGFDPDGRIASYQWKMSDNGTDGISVQDTLTFDPVTGDTLNAWTSIASTDSTFLVTADIPDFPGDPEGINRSYQTHTFLVRAIDEDGGVDPTPAMVSFNSTTLLPTVTLTGPAAAQDDSEAGRLPSTVTLLFEGADPDFETGIPTQVRYLWKPALLPNGSYATTGNAFRNNLEYLVSFDDSLWTDWQPYDTNDETRRIILPDQQELDASGESIFYAFCIQAKDTAGAVSIDRGYGQQVANLGITRGLSPTLTVLETFLGGIQGSGLYLQRSLDIAAGQILEFSWTADASGYAGAVESYRYGWDVSDINDPNDPNWAVPPGNSLQHRSAQPRSFNSGIHVLTIEVIDNSNQKTRATITLDVVPVPDPANQLPLLLVDDVKDQNSNSWPGPPPTSATLDRDAYRDFFWRVALGDPGGVAGWDSLSHTVDSEDRQLDYREAVGYRAIVWAGRWVAFPQSAISSQFRPAGGSVNLGDVDKYVWMTPYQESVGNLFYAGSQAMINYLAESSFELPIVFESREGNAATGYESVRDTDVRRAFGYRELPNGDLVQVGLSRFPFSTMGVSVVDLTSPTASYFEFGTGLLVSNRRTKACVALKGLEIDPDFKAQYMPGGDVFDDQIWTSSTIDWADDYAPQDQDVLEYNYTWGFDEFYNADVVGRGTGWTEQEGAEWGCPEGLCVEPMFRSISRYNWVRQMRQEADPTDTWPDGYYGDDGQPQLNDLCGDRSLKPDRYSAITHDQTVGFIANKPAANKPSQKGDVVFGFDPYRFDDAQMNKVIRWVLGEHFGLSMTAGGK